MGHTYIEFIATNGFALMVGFVAVITMMIWQRG
jgi:hypothetical protein